MECEIFCKNAEVYSMVREASPTCLFANMQVPVNNVSSHFEGENSREKARLWEEGKGPFNGENSGFCSITRGRPCSYKESLGVPPSPKHQESHDEVFRPVHIGTVLKSPICTTLRIRKGKHIDENNTREIFVGSLARRFGAPLCCVAIAYSRAIIMTSLRHFIITIALIKRAQVIPSGFAQKVIMRAKHLYFFFKAPY